MKNNQRLFLIDGSSFCYRAFYAIRGLSTSKGQPTNAVYGVIAMMKRLIAEEQPDYLAIAFDLPKPTFRHRRYEAYKEHRKPMPDPLVSQIPWIKEVLRAYRIPIFEVEGYEADDVLGTLAVRAARERMDVLVVTGDKDLLQLLQEGIRIYKPQRDANEVLDRQALEERWGIRPDQVVELMALMGDEVDGIPGIPGIGEKTALELIRKFGTTQGLMKAVQAEKAAGIKPAIRKALKEHRDQLQMSRELATLDTAVPLSVDWEEIRRKDPDRPGLRKLFQILEFRTLAKEMEPEPGSSPVQTELWEAADLSRRMTSLRASGRVALVPAPQGVGLAWAEGSAAWVAGGTAFPAELTPVLEDPAVRKICPNLKKLWMGMMKHGGPILKGELFDPCIASYLLDASRPSHELADLAMEFLEVPVRDADPCRAAALEAEAALRLADRMSEQIKERELDPLLNEIEIPLARVLARMEFVGIAVDPAAWQELGIQIRRELDRLVQEIHGEAGLEFNLNSPKQLAQVLFEQFKLPVVKRTKTGASTDEEVLRRLSLLHPLPGKVLEYRELAKLSSTYVEALPRLVNPETGRIHASFNQTVTATGRLSSSSPNLQNIPIRTELGRRIRRGFVGSGPEGLLLTADYSQIELRILAHLSEDEQLLEAFRNGEDIHRITASEIFHLALEAVTGRERAVAKTINFGILYGMTPFGLSKELEIEPAKADEFITQYFARYPGVRRYLDRSLEEAKRLGYALTLFRRRRYLPELSAKDSTVRIFAERMAINAPIQGSAADLIKAAMVQIDAALEQEGFRARMVCQVHDELIFDLPRQEMEPVAARVKEIMEAPCLGGRPVQLKVPIQVNVRTGRNWYEASHN